ncbi:hypothetical protein [Thiomicrospira sp. WB1]|uniref:hypothetical protein n=1 Tax=Thiomicrospira sp. WB1 TaxID=1685380 RepID=UPI00074865C3|nr:hypothetical protein [Thiomicrospira sp. WB1]KUJ71657.1 hypothetical protein AVO41_09085 [Thiomicrospira sp. WB1]
MGNSNYSFAKDFQVEKMDTPLPRGEWSISISFMVRVFADMGEERKLLMQFMLHYVQYPNKKIKPEQRIIYQAEGVNPEECIKAFKEYEHSVLSLEDRSNSILHLESALCEPRSVEYSAGELPEDLKLRLQ